MSQPSTPLSDQVFGAVIWQFLLQLFMRGAGFLSTMVLARLLVPQDFGVVAACYLMISFFNALYDGGSHVYLIKQKELVDGDADTVWTVRLIVACVVYLLLQISADFAAGILDEPEMVNALRVLGLVVIIQAFNNIGFILLRRDLQFRPITIAEASSRAVGIIVTITCGFLLRNYWALIAGTLVAASSRMVLSYVMCAYRPRFTFSRIRAQLSFNAWSSVSSIVGFFGARADHFLVSGSYGLSIYGIYNLASSLAFDVVMLLVGGIGSPLMSGFSRLQHKPAELSMAVTKSMLAVATVVTPTVFGAYLVGDLLVELVLGKQWAAVAPVLAAMTFFAAFHFLSDSASHALVTINGISATVIVNASAILTMVLLMSQIIPEVSIVLLAEIRAGFAGVTAVVFATLLFYRTRFFPQELAAALLIPFGSGLVAYVSGLVVLDLVEGQFILWRLLAIGGVSIIVYLGLMISLISSLKDKRAVCLFLYDLVSRQAGKLREKLGLASA